MVFLDHSKHHDIPGLVKESLTAFDAVKRAETVNEYLLAMTSLMRSISALSEIGSTLVEIQSINEGIEKIADAYRKRLN